MRVVPSSLHDDVADRLRELIFGGSLTPGSFIDEPALCEQLGISRTPLREALKVLTAEGLLPAGMEMMDSLCITAVNAYLGEEEYPADAAAVLARCLALHAGKAP